MKMLCTLCIFTYLRKLLGGPKVFMTRIYNMTNGDFDPIVGDTKAVTRVMDNTPS